MIVAAALRFGGAKSGSQTLIGRIDLVVYATEVLPLEPPVDRHYATIRQHLTSRGTPIGPNDFLISAHARAWAVSRDCQHGRMLARSGSPSAKLAQSMNPDSSELIDYQGPWQGLQSLKYTTLERVNG